MSQELNPLYKPHLYKLNVVHILPIAKFIRPIPKGRK